MLSVLQMELSLDLIYKWKLYYNTHLKIQFYVLGWWGYTKCMANTGWYMCLRLILGSLKLFFFYSNNLKCMPISIRHVKYFFNPNTSIRGTSVSL